MLERLGFPDIGDHRRFVAAVIVDAIGSGIYIPMSILYFLATTDLSAATIGVALSCAQLVSMPASVLMGGVVDRFGAKAVLLASNTVQAIGYSCYPFAHDLWVVIILTTWVAFGQAMFWGSFSPMVAAISSKGEREKWFGFLGAMRNVGLAVGGLVAGAVVTIDTVTGYHAVVVTDALSYALAFGLLRGVAAERHQQSHHDDSPGGWPEVLADRPYRTLVASNLCYAMAEMVLNVALPVYLVAMLGLPGWLTGAVFVLNTVMVGIGQGIVVRRMTGLRRPHVLVAGWTMSALAYVGFAVAGAVGASMAVAVALVATVALTLGEMTNGPVLSAIAVDSAPAHLRGRYLGLYQLSWTSAGAVSPALFTWLLGQGTYALWLALGVVVLAGLVLIGPMRRALPVADGVVSNTATG